MLSPTITRRRHSHEDAIELSAGGGDSGDGGDSADGANGRAAHETPPAALTALFVEISRMLGRAPRFGLTDWVLCNWVVVSPRVASPTPALSAAPTSTAAHDVTQEQRSESSGEEAGDADERPRKGSMEHVQPALRFLCIEEEDWFLRLHATLAGESSTLIGALNRCTEAEGVAEQAR